MTPYISVVSPVYKAALIIPVFVEKLKQELELLNENFEIILVEDGSADKSWEKIVEETKKDKRVKGIKLSKNFGQHYAITAGLDYAHGEWVVVMDCDLQDSPSEIINLLQKAREGHKIVLARREVRHDSFFKKLSSILFYKILSVLTGVKQDATIANFGIYHKDVVDTIKKMREPFRSFAAMIKWVGFSPIAINVKHAERFDGKSTYNLRKLLKLAIDTILAYSNTPLYYIVVFGFAISLLSFVASLVVLIKYLSGYITVLGYTSLILSVWLLGGLLMMFLGIVGLYIGKIFQAVKGRPIYVITETENIN
ncbi:MAG TPA: glycosyltransferase family 2 protein [Chitinophagaceae bacterium]|nr:glycosyltransferase family 2 protein [Chitinophagaceae bacterium]